MKKAIVTGASGFLGSALINELSVNDIKVFAIVRNENSNIQSLENLKNVEIIYCNMENIKAIPSLVLENDIDIWYHFAWEGTSGEKRGDYNIQLKNVECSCKAIKISKTMGCKKFVFASSIMEYECIQIMKSEIKPPLSNIYSSSKITANYMLKTLCNAEGIDYISALISNVYGVGEISERLICTTINKLLNNEETYFTSGEQTYDFIYITDIAKAFFYIGEFGIKNKNYYLGSHEPKPLKLFLDEIKNIISPNKDIGLGKLQFNGISLNYDSFDIFAVKNDTGFSPTVSFSDGIEKTIAWLKNNNIKDSLNENIPE